MNLNPKKWGWSWWKINQERIQDSRIAVMEPTREMIRKKLHQEFNEAEMPTLCEVADSAKAFKCQTEEQCDDCWLVDHLKECSGCNHVDHPVIPFPEPTLEDLNRMCIEAVQKRDPSLPF